MTSVSEAQDFPQPSKFVTWLSFLGSLFHIPTSFLSSSFPCSPVSQQHPPLTQKSLEDHMPAAPGGTVAPGSGRTLGRRVIVSIMRSLKMCPFLGPCLEGLYQLCLKSNSRLCRSLCDRMECGLSEGSERSNASLNLTATDLLSKIYSMMGTQKH